jgi:hypothetical protein
VTGDLESYCMNNTSRDPVVIVIFNHSFISICEQVLCTDALVSRAVVRLEITEVRKATKRLFLVYLGRSKWVGTSSEIVVKQVTVCDVLTSSDLPYPVPSSCSCGEWCRMSMVLLQTSALSSHRLFSQEVLGRLNCRWPGASM